MAKEKLARMLYAMDDEADLFLETVINGLSTALTFAYDSLCCNKKAEKPDSVTPVQSHQRFARFSTLHIRKPPGCE